jgi:phosphoesterase RecJ-like protein
MENNSLKELRKKYNARTVLIFAHQNPDGDAIGSAVAAGLLCKEFGKQVMYTLKKDVKGCSELLPETDHFDDTLLEQYDLGIVLDCSSIGYLEGRSELERCAEIIVMNHHGRMNGRNYNYIDPAAAASGEVVYALIQACETKMTEEMAHAVYIALVEDTGNFSFPNTTGRTHEIVAELYKICSDFDYYATQLKKYPKENLELMCAFLNRLSYLHGTDMIIGVLRFDMIGHYPQTDTDGLIDLIVFKGAKWLL